MDQILHGASDERENQYVNALQTELAEEEIGVYACNADDDNNSSSSSGGGGGGDGNSGSGIDASIGAVAADAAAATTHNNE